MASIDDLQARFTQLHTDGTFVMPNPWDVGSARILEAVGFPALATTSAGYALTLGKRDQQVTLGELLDHSRAVARSVGVPLNVDSERCFADTLAGVAETVTALAESGAAGCSIEDYDPEDQAIDPIGLATDRVGAAAEAAHHAGLVLTARAENHLYGIDDLDDTIARLRSYRRAGADVLYAPGLTSLADITRMVAAVEAPVNVLLMAGGPAVADLAEVGVRRISSGGALTRSVYAGLVSESMKLRDEGTAPRRQDDATRSMVDEALT